MPLVPTPARTTTRRSILKATLALPLGIAATKCSFGVEPNPIRLRLLSYNIHHGEGTDGKIDLPRLAEVIRNSQPDLVALQEVDDGTLRAGGVDQTAELARLTGLHGRFGKQIDFEGGGYGQAILSRFPIDDLRVHWLPGEPEREQRIAVEARIRIGDRGVSFVSTHLHHHNAAIRERQAAELNELFARSDRLTFLAGDLNATPESVSLGTLSQEWKVAAVDQPLWTYPADKPQKQLDYVLAWPKNAFKILDVTVIDEPVASDHRPILATVELIRE